MFHRFDIWLIIIFVSFLLFCLEIISLAAAIIITIATLILDLVLMFIVSCYTKNPNDNFIKTKEFGENKIPKKTEKKIQNIKRNKIKDMNDKKKLNNLVSQIKYVI